MFPIDSYVRRARRAAVAVVTVYACIMPAQAQQAHVRGDVGISLVGADNMMRVGYAPAKGNVQIDLADTDYQIAIDRSELGQMLVLVSY